MQLRNPLSKSQHGLHPLMTVLFVLLKLVFVPLPSGTVLVDVPSASVVSGVVNNKIRPRIEALISLKRLKIKDQFTCGKCNCNRV